MVAAEYIAVNECRRRLLPIQASRRNERVSLVARARRQNRPAPDGRWRRGGAPPDDPSSPTSVVHEPHPARTIGARHHRSDTARRSPGAYRTTFESLSNTARRPCHCPKRPKEKDPWDRTHRIHPRRHSTRSFPGWTIRWSSCLWHPARTASDAWSVFRPSAVSTPALRRMHLEAEPYRRHRGAADTMVVHFLRPNDKALARLFGEETDDEIPKFDRCSWHPAPTTLRSSPAAIGLAAASCNGLTSAITFSMCST